MSPLLRNWNQKQRDEWVAAQAVQVAPGSRVLDIGAGGCPYRALFAHCRYEAQDAAPLDADQIREGGYGQLDHICDASAIPVERGTFDVVLCTEVLEHVAHPIDVVREIGRVLKPGGRAIITAPLGSGLHQEPHHYYGGYTPWWYRRFLTEAGFDAIEITANSGSFSHFAQWCEWAIGRIRRAALTGAAGVRVVSAILIVPALLVLLPAAVVARLIDPAVADQEFTVGYFVRARRASDRSSRDDGRDAITTAAASSGVAARSPGHGT